MGGKGTKQEHQIDVHLYKSSVHLYHGNLWKCESHGKGNCRLPSQAKDMEDVKWNWEVGGPEQTRGSNSLHETYNSLVQDVDIRSLPTYKKTMDTFIEEESSESC